MAGRFSVEAVFKAVDRITAPVSKMQNRLGKFTRAAGRGVRNLNRRMNAIAGGLKRVGIAAVASMAIVGGAFANVLGAGADFEQAITNVGAVGLKTRAEVKPLEDLALKLGRTTKFTATQSANAMEIMARAGFNVNDILTATPAVLSAAAASGLEIAEVANVVSNALKGMGLETNEAARVSDVLALASSKTNSTIGSLGESLKNVASTARQLNVPLEDTVAAVALLQDVGLDASVAGSAFNTMLTKMAAPVPAMVKKMKKFGITFKDASGDMLPLEQVLQQLNVASKKAGGNFDKVAFLAELVGLRGQKAASNLGMLFETGKLTELTAKLREAEGSAKKMADIRMNTVQGSMLLLGSAVDAVKVKIFGLQGGALKGTIDKMTEWVNANERLIATNVSDFFLGLINNLGNIWSWMKRIGVALAVFYSFALVIKTLTAAMAIFNFVVALNPLTLMIAGILAAGAAVGALIIYSDDLLESFHKLPDIIRVILAPLGIMLEMITGIKSITNSIGTKLGGALFDIFNNDDDKAGTGAALNSQVVTPQERIARSVDEHKTTSTAEVKLTTDPGTNAEVVGGALPGGVAIQPSGAM